MAHDCDINVTGIVRVFDHNDTKWAFHVIQLEEGLAITAAVRIAPGSEADDALTGRTADEQSEWFNVRFLETFYDISYLWPQAELCHVCRPPDVEDWHVEVSKHLAATYKELEVAGVHRVHIEHLPRDVSMTLQLWKRDLWEVDPKTIN